MRLSSVQIFQQGLSAMLDQQTKLQRTEQQLATGKRILNPSDDPVGTVQALNITQDLERIDQYQRNGNIAEGQLALEESVLTNTGNLLQRVRELVVQGNNATQTPETRQSIAKEISGKINELLALANTQDSNGEYIFAGFQAGSQPFSLSGSNLNFNGDSGQRFLQLGNSIKVAVRDSGSDVFMAVPNGNGVFLVDANPANTGTASVGTRSETGNFLKDTYNITFSQPTPSDPVIYQVLDSSLGVVATGNHQAGQSITFAGIDVVINGNPADGDSFQVTPASNQDMFATLQAIISGLENATANPSDIAKLNTSLGQGLDNLDQAISHVLDLRADVGVRLNQVDNQQDLNETFNLQLQQTLSEVQDLDYAEAISRLNLQLAALQAAQQSYVKVQGLSLFNYL